VSAKGRAQQVVELFRAWRDRPEAVDAGWREFFGALDEGARAHLDRIAGTAAPSSAAPAATTAPADAAGSRAAALDSIRAMALIDAYRTRGHLAARLDPLGLKPIGSHPELDPQTFGFTQSDLDRPIFLGGELGFHEATLREVIAHLRRIYCGIVGIEYMHIQDPAQRSWIQQRVEGAQHRAVLKREGKLEILDHLTQAGDVRALHPPQVGRHQALRTRRRGVGDPSARTDRAACGGARRRGDRDRHAAPRAPERARQRDAQALSRDLRRVLRQHRRLRRLRLGRREVPHGHVDRPDRARPQGAPLALRESSHLEAVDPVVLGKVRAKQDLRDDKTRRSVMGLLLHGDAAFAGQGLVAETLTLSELKGYDTGGTFHLIINNQIGFTTDPTSARSGPYCSDVGLMIQVPIVHVNGDYPEAVVAVVGFATEFLLQFGKDVIVDLFCYRRYGHNEADEPMFTQPLMYQRIAERQPVRAAYARHLREEGTLTAGEADAMVEVWQTRLEKEFEVSKQHSVDRADWLEGTWSGLEPVKGYDARRGKTAVDLETLREVGRALTAIPADFAAHKKLQKLFEAKAHAIQSGEGIDWATAEALAFGTLLIEGSRSGSPDRTRSAAPSRSATRRSSIRTTDDAMCRSTTSASTRRRSSCSTARSRSCRCSASSTVIRRRTRARSYSGRRSSATSRTARRW
jgi:2-oxoglutarate dehydrogenase E1 component